MDRNQIANNNQVGVRVSGTYMGAAFSGVVVSERPTYGVDMSYGVELDAVIYPFGNTEDPRDFILLDLDGMEGSVLAA